MRKKLIFSFSGLILFLVPVFLYGQCDNTKRTYADTQASFREGLGALGIPFFAGSISNASNAADGDVSKASTLSVELGLIGLASTTQFLQFTSGGSPRNLPISKPVTLKISLPTEVLSLLSGLEIGTFTNLQHVSEYWPTAGLGHYDGYNATTTALYNSSNIAGVVSGAGEMEITLTPTELYNGVYVKVKGNLLSVDLSVQVFHAYIMEEVSTVSNCDEIIDVLSGVQPSVVGGVLNTTASVDNPFNAVDGSENSFARLNIGVSVLNKTYLTPVFSKQSVAGDSVNIILGKTGGGLLDLSLLTGFVIQPYLGATKAGPAFSNAGTFLSLNLLNGSTNKYKLTFPVNNAYDRIEITTGGLAGVLSSIDIFDISRKMVVPSVKTGIAAEDNRSICYGNTTQFTIQNPQACTTYNWFDAETGGNLLATGASYTTGNTLAVGDYTFYIHASRNFCTKSAETVPVKLKVNALPTVSVANVTICAGSTATLSVASPDAAFTYNWYTSSLGGTIIHSGTSYTSAALTSNTSFYVEAINSVTGCKNAGGLQSVTVLVKPYATVPAIVGANTMCAGTNQTVSNSYSGGIWTTSDATIATVDATGKVMALSGGNVTIQYTVASDGTYCGKTIGFTIAVNPQPNLTLGPDLGICEGQATTTLPYSNAINSPTLYNIAWVGNALPAVSEQALPANSISLTIPSNTPPAVYAGVLTLKNALGCEQEIPFSFRVRNVPHKPIISIQ
ncbi:Ig-like domain-containing protein [Pedobacter sp. MW01-1-1]|uniref:Ig-like domain-containing protein n=1 Tax=Pedobacter sp. MW01-1-1 TaxID=3383027 RepID=UPI003FEE7465